MIRTTTETTTETAEANAAKKSKASEELLVKKFQKDFEETLVICELDTATSASEIQLTEIMARLGFVRIEQAADIEAVQSIWPHLRPVNS